MEEELSTPLQTITEEYDDPGISVTCTYGVFDYHVTIVCKDGDATLFQGSIKWDGCANLTFGDTNEGPRIPGYLHLCDLSAFGKLLQRVYQRCGELCPHADDLCFDNPIALAPAQTVAHEQLRKAAFQNLNSARGNVFIVAEALDNTLPSAAKTALQSAVTFIDSALVTLRETQ